MAHRSLPGLTADVVFSLLHNILPVQVRRHRPPCSLPPLPSLPSMPWDH
jgi:hypothetical protein